MLVVDDAVLLVVDVQGNLAQAMHEKEALFDALRRVIRGAQALEIPILRAEQNPEGLGPTIPEIDALLPESPPFSKLSFSCCGNVDFVRELEALSRKQVLVAGIEAHVCVYQTARDLAALGYEVHVVADAVSSRTAGNRSVGLQRMRELGAVTTSVEMALFELLRTAEGPAFKELLRIVK